MFASARSISSSGCVTAPFDPTTGRAPGSYRPGARCKPLTDSFPSSHVLQCHQGWCKRWMAIDPAFSRIKKIHRVLPVARQQFHSPSPPKVNILRYRCVSITGIFQCHPLIGSIASCQHGGVISPVYHAKTVMAASKRTHFESDLCDLTGMLFFVHGPALLPVPRYLLPRLYVWCRAS